MKQSIKLKTGLFMLVGIIVTLVLSCQKESVDITASRNEFVLDSMRLADSIADANEAAERKLFEEDRAYDRAQDSLEAINQSGGISYAINVVDGSASSFTTGRTNATETLVTGASVTVSQFGKTETKTTTATGTVVFSGFFRNSLNVTVTKAGYTSANYIVAVAEENNTPNGTFHYVGNIIPLFPTTGPNTATISGYITIQTDLTNKVRETVPDGTTLTVGIDASDPTFRTKFLNSLTTLTNIANQVTYGSGNNDPNTFFVGEIIVANYETGVVGSTTAGTYTITVPAAFDGLPLVTGYSQLAATQTLFESGGVIPGDRTATYRTLFGSSPIAYSSIPSGSSVSIGFDAGSGATATAVISNIDGALKSINITAGGSGYIVAPEVVIAAPTLINGTQATATATITNGSVTGITLVTAGSGYKTAPGVSFLNGGGASANFGGLIANGTVTGVKLDNTGDSYTTAPTVTFSAPGGTGTTATGTALIDGQGRVSIVSITNGGSQYVAPPTVTFSAAPGTGVTATGTALWTGLSVGNVVLTSGGSDYLSAPVVTIAKPTLANGVTATAIAIYDAGTRTVSAIQVTNSGSGYTSLPSIAITPAGSGASATALLDGGSVISAEVTGQGTTPYVAAPKVSFSGGDGTGAIGTAIISDGKVIGVTITNGGTGYTSAPTITLSAGDGAEAYATVTNGVITSITVSDGGRDWVGAPRVTISSSVGGGATATSTVSGGSISAVTLSSGGAGYLEGNTPGSTESFLGPTGPLPAKPGLKYVIDVHYGTGKRMPN